MMTNVVKIDRKPDFDNGKIGAETQSLKNMETTFYQELTTISLNGELLSDATCEKLLTASEIELLPLLDAAYKVRKTYFQNEVQLHILNNAQNGYCPEDCHYCAQASSATTDIEDYPLKPDAEILAEAERAHKSGAYRYCIVMSGRGPSPKRVAHLAKLIRTVKADYPIEVCLSAGLIDVESAGILKEAGLDRLNHNLNTSEAHYPQICSTHSYQDRMDTLQAAQTVGLACCSGVIVGMGEGTDDLIKVAKELRQLEVASLPVNFFLPISGTQLSESVTAQRSVPTTLTPDYCLRVLCLYRFLNPRAEIRIAAGREHHLRSMEVMALYPANSMFIDGYLNAEGSTASRTLEMIRDSGFTVKTNGDDTEQLKAEETERRDVPLKELKVLRPRMESDA